MSSKAYVGTELDLFATAVNWKQYYASRVAGYVRGDVLEVGAGIGGTTGFLYSRRATSWLCLEPDPALATTLARTVSDLREARDMAVSIGVVDDLESSRQFDCILYIDVLEHIEDDRAEMQRAAEHLRPGGYIVVLSPAHQFLFSEFDSRIGHFRRYNRRSLSACRPSGLVPQACFYLDAASTLLSLANRLLLRSESPTKIQIRMWDRFVVPVSRLLDRLLRYRVGKSIVVVWKNPA